MWLSEDAASTESLHSTLIYNQKNQETNCYKLKVMECTHTCPPYAIVIGKLLGLCYIYLKNMISL